MKRTARAPLQILILALALLLGSGLQAQTAPSCVDPAMSEMAAHISQSLQTAYAKKVIVADFTGPNGESHPVGKWLADRLSECLTALFPDLGVMSRPADGPMLNIGAQKDRLEATKSAAKKWAHHLGAKVVIAGSFAEAQQGIAISLVAIRSSGSGDFLGVANGQIATSDEIAKLSSDPLPKMETRTYRAGVGGTGVPQCIYCPAPSYTNQARREGFEGSVVLEVTITPEGYATNIKIVRDPGQGLGMKAVEAVRKWKFKPALGPMGQPVPVIVPIEVTFHLYK